MQAKVRIESDGTPQGTKVFQAETGEEIKGIRSIKWAIDVGKIATATIEFVVVEITALGELYAQHTTRTEVEKLRADASITPELKTVTVDHGAEFLRTNAIADAEQGAACSEN